MKFTNEYWRIRETIDPVYAVEYYDSGIHGKKLTVFVAMKNMSNRGDILNQPMLTVRPEILLVK